MSRAAKSDLALVVQAFSVVATLKDEKEIAYEAYRLLHLLGVAAAGRLNSGPRLVREPQSRAAQPPPEAGLPLDGGG